MPDTIDITIEGIAAGGRGVGFVNRKGGRKPAFVPYTIPGEVVRARITSDGERHIEAEGVTLVEASADRVYPGCQHFGVSGRCALCQWQHISPDAQRALKAEIVADQLSRLGRLSDREIERALRPTIAAPAEWGYNHHITFGVIHDADIPEGEPSGRLGLPSIDDGRLFVPNECPITHPDLIALMDGLDLDLTGIRRVRLEVGSDGSLMVLLSLITENDAPELEADFPASVNILLPDNEPMNLIGDSHTRYEVNGRWFRATAGSYFRANVAGVGRLASAVADLLDAQSNEAVLDLYAGVGVLSAAAAERAALVTLVESYPPTATDADENLSDLDYVEVIEGGALDALESLEEHYDAVIVDPPSSGLGDEIVQAIGERGPSRVIYVAGDPAALGRDAKRLAAAGYRLTVAQPVDLAPQTYYVDTVARFERGS